MKTYIIMCLNHGFKTYTYIYDTSYVCVHVYELCTETFVLSK